MFKEKQIQTKKGLSIYTESTGNPNHPPILLIMGALNQGIFWYDSFCRSLSKDFYVIRFDHRDTGFSSVIDFKETPYDLNDLTEDAVDILNAYQIDKTNLIGLSMGGYICQLLGINYSDRVNTLTLISTTPDHRPYMDATMGNFNSQYNLPYPEKSYLDYIERSKINPPQNESEWEKNQIEGWKATFNDISGEDFEEVIRLVKLSNQRSRDKYSAFHHGQAVLNSSERTDLLKKISAPAFIFHGEKDPCLPLEHGKRLHRLIPHSKLEIVKGMGHMFSLTEAKVLAGKVIKNIGEC